MIIGAGTDLVEVDRFRRFLERRGARALERLFTPAERAYCLRQAVPASSLAARFAAKEAFFKALGTGCGQAGRWREVEVARGLAGRPMLRLHGAAERSARAAGARALHVSLSHTREHATAMVVLES